MNEKIKPILDKVKGFFKGMSKTVRIILIVVLCAAVVAIAGLAIFHASRPYTVLYTGMNADEMREVLAYLGTNNITDFRVVGEDTILVPEGEAAPLQARLAMEGYPSSGFVYGTYLKNAGALSSQSDRELLEQYELQDRLGATIECFDGVQDAVVNISLGEDSRYILDREDMVPATASVTLTMQGNRMLTNQQASAIRNLVSHSVKGLNFEDVTISDTAGNPYEAGTEADASENSTLKFALEKRVNNMVRDNVLNLLTPAFGSSNVSVSVKSTVNVSKKYIESVDYTGEDGTSWNDLGGHGLIGEFIWNNSIGQEAGDNAAGGVPGTTTNSDLNEYMTNPDNLTGGDGQGVSSSGSIKHDNDQVKTQEENIGGVVTDIMVAVSINSAAAENVDVAALVGPVARAAGITVEDQDAKVSIVTLPFNADTNAGEDQRTGWLAGLPDWTLYAMIAGGALFLVLLFIFLLLRSRAKRRKMQQEQEEQLRLMEEQLRALQEAQAQPAEGEGEEQPSEDQQGAQIEDLHSERTMELRQDVREFAEQNPELAAQMVKAWLKGGDEHA